MNQLHRYGYIRRIYNFFRYCIWWGHRGDWFQEYNLDPKLWKDGYMVRAVHTAQWCKRCFKQDIN